MKFSGTGLELLWPEARHLGETLNPGRELGGGLGFGIWGLGFGVWGFWGLGFRVWGLGFRVWGGGGGVGI